ncbi:GNAT family N-acetyltransferase [Streptomyces neyagawaensis]|uniref:GNAT family N-acetyltransferase n=1 Tax=Streptomyces neyagawaensis TaxID=42238 RepID=UPI00099EED15|nr:GNAT family N-acetyltransferase [Streptomyces neyagawaensis]MCL6732795.1 GNAT family N-acetyltransferase [Streptomyces neyagawaensis]MDE1681436.1 GNAT family N-acetyltransferase [Streptomyces neyagawaensis]
MGLVRRATDGDAAEVLRLRQVMIDSLAGTPGATDWHAAALPTLTSELADHGGRFAAFVVDLPERPGTLAALAAGTLEYRIGRTGNPHGLIGYVFSVATDPGARRRGYARACVEELLDWFRERGAGYVMLTASPDAEPLYASLGFTRDTDPRCVCSSGPHRLVVCPCRASP